MPFLPFLPRNASDSAPSCTDDPSSGTFPSSCSSPGTTGTYPASNPGQLAVIGVVSCAAFLVGAVAFAWWLYSYRKRHTAVPAQVQVPGSVVRIPRKVFLAARQQQQRKRAADQHELDQVRTVDLEGLETMNTFTTTMLDGFEGDTQESKPEEAGAEPRTGVTRAATHRSLNLASLPTLTYTPPDVPSPAYHRRESYIAVPSSMPTTPTTATPVSERGPP